MRNLPLQHGKTQENLALEHQKKPLLKKLMGSPKLVLLRVLVKNSEGVGMGEESSSQQEKIELQLVEQLVGLGEISWLLGSLLSSWLADVSTQLSKWKIGVAGVIRGSTEVLSGLCRSCYTPRQRRKQRERWNCY